MFWKNRNNYKKALNRYKIYKKVPHRINTIIDIGGKKKKQYNIAYKTSCSVTLPYLNINLYLVKKKKTLILWTHLLLMRWKKGDPKKHFNHISNTYDEWYIMHKRKSLNVIMFLCLTTCGDCKHTMNTKHKCFGDALTKRKHQNMMNGSFICVVRRTKSLLDVRVPGKQLWLLTICHFYSFLEMLTRQYSLWDSLTTEFK